MAGGRRFNFSVAIVIGDKKGRVGVGLGKAADTQLAIEKATRAAKRAMITLNLTKNRCITHNVEAKYCASVVEIRPSPGRGLSQALPCAPCSSSPASPTSPPSF